MRIEACARAWRASALGAGALAIVATTTGCPLSSGACSYGASGGKEGDAPIAEIAPSPATGQVTVRTGDPLPASIVLTQAAFEQCVQARQWAVGSTVHVQVTYGGSCPPRYSLAGCP